MKMNEVKVKEKEEFVFWKYIDSFINGLESEGVSRDVEAICSAAFIGARRMGLDMPNDFEPKGMAGVISPTVLWELYGLRNRNGAPGHKVDTGPEYAKACEIGAKLAKYDQKQMSVTALYLMYSGKYLDASDIDRAKKVLEDIDNTVGTAKAKK
jgi:hypothetical protein